MHFQQFSAANRYRSESREGFGHHLRDWSLSDWMTALVGEIGEAANIAKKLNRIRDGANGNAKGETADKLRPKLADELADAFIYLDLLAQSEGFDLEEIVLRKFNKTSRKLGYPKLEAAR